MEVTLGCSRGWENTQVPIYSAAAPSQAPHLGLTMLCLYKWLLTQLLIPIPLGCCVVDGITKLIHNIKHRFIFWSYYRRRCVGASRISHSVEGTVCRERLCEK